MSDRRDETRQRVTDWFTERLPTEWLASPPDIEVDSDEILLVLPLSQQAATGDFRERTRAARIKLAQQAEETFGRTVSWGTVREGSRRLYTTLRSVVAAPVAMPERKVLDTLVEAGVASDRSDALAWCIRLVGQHEADWLRDLRDATAANGDARVERPVQI